MHTQTKTPTAAVLEPEYLSAQWVYDVLMQEIEPDLVTDNLSRLDQIYSDETDVERTIRMERYQQAFEVLQECLEDLKTDCKMDVLHLQKEMNNVAHEDENDQTQKAIDEIEEQIDNSDFRA